MIGVVEALVEVLINSSSECFQGWTVDQVGGRSFHSLAVLGRMNVFVHQSLSTGWDVSYCHIVLVMKCVIFIPNF